MTGKAIWGDISVHATFSSLICLPVFPFFLWLRQDSENMESAMKTLNTASIDSKLKAYLSGTVIK